MLYFNSIKVRLEHSKTAGDILRNTLFQFHKGTIRTKEDTALPQHGQDFNSIKVRLELPVITIFVPFALFQFHKGTIRTPCEGKNNTFKT